MFGADIDLIVAGKGDRKGRRASGIIARPVGPKHRWGTELVPADVLIDRLPVEGPRGDSGTPIVGVDEVEGEIECLPGGEVREVEAGAVPARPALDVLHLELRGEVDADPNCRSQARAGVRHRHRHRCATRIAVGDLDVRWREVQQRVIHQKVDRGRGRSPVNGGVIAGLPVTAEPSVGGVVQPLAGHHLSLELKLDLPAGRNLLEFRHRGAIPDDLLAVHRPRRGGVDVGEPRPQCIGYHDVVDRSQAGALHGDRPGYHVPHPRLCLPGLFTEADSPGEYLHGEGVRRRGEEPAPLGSHHMGSRNGIAVSAKVEAYRQVLARGETVAVSQEAVDIPLQIHPAFSGISLDRRSGVGGDDGRTRHVNEVEIG